MLNIKSVGRLLKNPSVVLKRLFPWRARYNDPECFHLISAWSSGNLPRVRIQDVFPSGSVESCSVVIRKAEARAIGWSLDFPELVHILSVVKSTKAKHILEIGTYDGFTTLNIAANLYDGGEVCTLDLCQNQDDDQLPSNGETPGSLKSGIVGSQFFAEPEASLIKQHWGDSTRVNWDQFGPPFDLIFIDGCHEYSFVRRDSLNALKHIRPGGTIFWHDYGQFPDVSKAVDELANEHPIKVIAGTRLACLRMPETK